MKKILQHAFYVGLTLLTLLNISLATDLNLPLASVEQWKVGQYWKWTYYERGDLSTPYSYEQYTVEKIEGEVVTFLMSTRFPGEEKYKTHHKFMADFAKCKKAFARRGHKLPWHVKMYYKAHDQSGQWILKSSYSPSLAFEEKFNCAPHFYQGHPRLETVLKHFDHPLWGTLQTFAEKSLLSSTAHQPSYYIKSPEFLAGVTFWKEFNPGTQHYYIMRLEETGIEVKTEESISWE